MNRRGLSSRTQVEFVDTLGKMDTGFRIAGGWERCKECRIEEGSAVAYCRFAGSRYLVNKPIWAAGMSADI